MAYPDFQYLFQSIFKVDIPFLSTIKTFGFFVAIAFLLAAWILTKELKRKEAAGLLSPELVPFSKGKKFIPKKQRVTTKLAQILYSSGPYGETTNPGFDIIRKIGFFRQ